MGVFLDFDENNCPVNLEILSASKRIGIDKKFLINPNGNVSILINSDLITLGVYFEIDSEEYHLHYADKHIENLKINDLETNFALV